MNVDLENGFAHAPEEAAEAIRLAAEAGAAGGSIEDFDRRPQRSRSTISTRRWRASRRRSRVARAQPVPFLLTARAENLIRGRNDMADTIRRLQAYEEAGADVLYAPGLRNLAEVRQVVRRSNRPFNVVTGWLDPAITAANWPRPAPSASASAARCHAWRWPPSSTPAAR